MQPHTITNARTSPSSTSSTTCSPRAMAIVLTSNRSPRTMSNFMTVALLASPGAVKEAERVADRATDSEAGRPEQDGAPRERLAHGFRRYDLEGLAGLLVLNGALRHPRPPPECSPSLRFIPS